MAIRYVNTELWSDSKFADDFSPEDKYFWLMLLTTRYGNLSGCFEFSIKQMSKESGLNVEVIEKIIKRFINSYKMIDYNDDTKEILILNWYRYNWTKSPKLKISLERCIEQIKCLHFKDYVKESFKRYGNDTVSIEYAYLSIPIPITNTITNTNIGKENSNDKESTLSYLDTYSKSLIRKAILDPMFDTKKLNEWLEDADIKSKDNPSAWFTKVFPAELEKGTFNKVIKPSPPKTDDLPNWEEMLDDLETPTKQEEVDITDKDYLEKVE